MKQWAAVTPAAAEAAVLSFIPVYSKSIKPAAPGSEEANKPTHTNPPLETTDDRVCMSREVTVAPKRHLNEFSITRPDVTNENPAPNNLVILHGYGAGLAFFYKNFEYVKTE